MSCMIRWTSYQPIHTYSSARLRPVPVPDVIILSSDSEPGSPQKLVVTSRHHLIVSLDPLSYLYKHDSRYVYIVY